jgi:hypothetical protein
MTELPQVPPRCIHLHGKALAVYGEGFEDDPDYQADLTDFWCVRTARPLGPDGREASPRDCRDPGRDCYQEY